MADKRLDIHPAALEELKRAVSWYVERTETAAIKFVAEIDKAVKLIAESPSRWPWGARDAQVRSEALSICSYLP